MSAKWPKAVAKLIEDKANGPAVIQELQHQIAGLIAVNPEGGKIARARAAAAQIESGNVYLPHPATAEWVDGFVEEAVAFPNGRHDDQVDAMTQALNRMRDLGSGFCVLESRVVVQPFQIPAAWRRAFAMQVTANGVSALWAAKDEHGMIYVYADHVHPHAEPSQNARAIKAQGDWVPGLITADSGSRAERERIARLYREQDLNIQAPNSGDEGGQYQLLELLESNQLKVMTSVENFLAEYRIGEQDSPLLSCCRALISAGRRCMRTKPDPRTHRYLEPIYHGERSWMH